MYIHKVLYKQAQNTYAVYTLSIGYSPPFYNSTFNIMKWYFIQQPVQRNCQLIYRIFQHMKQLRASPKLKIVMRSLKMPQSTFYTNALSLWHILHDYKSIFNLKK